MRHSQTASTLLNKYFLIAKSHITSSMARHKRTELYYRLMIRTRTIITRQTIRNCYILQKASRRQKEGFRIASRKSQHYRNSSETTRTASRKKTGKSIQYFKLVFSYEDSNTSGSRSRSSQKGSQCERFQRNMNRSRIRLEQQRMTLISQMSRRSNGSSLSRTKMGRESIMTQ